MSTWNIYIEESDGSFTLDGTVPRPNQDMETSIESTQNTIVLANGDEAYVIPEIKSKKGTIQIFWADSTSTLRTQILGYIGNGDKIKIITHTNEEFIGRFISMKRVWFTGMTDTYDIQVVMKEI